MKWNELETIIRTLREEHIFVDVTLDTDGQQIQVHNTILSAGSQV